MAGSRLPVPSISAGADSSSGPGTARLRGAASRLRHRLPRANRRPVDVASMKSRTLLLRNAAPRQYQSVHRLPGPARSATRMPVSPPYAGLDHHHGGRSPRRRAPAHRWSGSPRHSRRRERGRCHRVAGVQRNDVIAPRRPGSWPVFSGKPVLAATVQHQDRRPIRPLRHEFHSSAPGYPERRERDRLGTAAPHHGSSVYLAGHAVSPTWNAVIKVPSYWPLGFRRLRWTMRAGRGERESTWRTTMAEPHWIVKGPSGDLKALTWGPAGAPGACACTAPDTLRVAQSRTPAGRGQLARRGAVHAWLCAVTDSSRRYHVGALRRPAGTLGCQWHRARCDHRPRLGARSPLPAWPRQPVAKAVIAIGAAVGSISPAGPGA